MRSVSNKIERLKTITNKCQFSISNTICEIECDLDDDELNALIAANQRVVEAIEQIEIAIDIRENSRTGWMRCK